jgi:hypothetical protein
MGLKSFSPPEESILYIYLLKNYKLTGMMNICNAKYPISPPDRTGRE